MQPNDNLMAAVIDHLCQEHDLEAAELVLGSMQVCMRLWGGLRGWGSKGSWPEPASQPSQQSQPCMSRLLACPSRRGECNPRFNTIHH